MRVLVVRPQDEAERTAAVLDARGHAAIVAPVLRIEALSPALPSAPPDAFAVTSARAAPATAVIAGLLRAAVPVFAVGDATAAALEATGLAPVRAPGGDGASLARAIVARLGPGARVLHVAGRDRRPEPGRSLEAGGLVVDVAEVYAVVPAERLPARVRNVLATGEVDAVLHYSPRSAAVLKELVAEAGLTPAFAGLGHACLSRAVADALGPGWRRAVAGEPNEAALIDALERLGR